MDIERKIPLLNFLFTLTVPLYHCSMPLAPKALDFITGGRSKPQKLRQTEATA